MTRERIFYDIPPVWHENRKKGLCPVCGKDKSLFDRLQKVYCSTVCRDEYTSRIITWSELREKALKQYGEKCKACGISKEALNRNLSDKEKQKAKEWALTHKAEIEHYRAELLRRAEELYQDAMNDELVIMRACPYDIKHVEHVWNFEVDHVVAITNGGDEWDIENLQVLCPDCHKAKTRRDMKIKRVGAGQ